ncbi:MAG: hypothetical protein DIU60_001990 [Actinomycetes bacterium]|jgi:hypothetical protein|nr:MAG: hypothetical protein DIU60_05540 [Actinomycetota bacterium]
MDELKPLLAELEHRPPPTLARQRLRLDEAVARAGRAGRGPARWFGGRRLAVGGALAGLAAAAGFAVPALVGTDTPAYALTKNPDGSINLQIHEFRDPDQVERDLAKLGVRADITYLPLGKRCGNSRGRLAPEDDVKIPLEMLNSKDPKVREEVWKRLDSRASARAVRAKNGITIYPEHIKPGRTVVLEVMENSAEPDGDRPRVLWQFGSRLVVGPVAPCQVVDDPTAHEIGDATPPPGS